MQSAPAATHTVLAVVDAAAAIAAGIVRMGSAMLPSPWSSPSGDTWMQAVRAGGHSSSICPSQSLSIGVPTSQTSLLAGADGMQAPTTPAVHAGAVLAQPPIPHASVVIGRWLSTMVSQSSSSPLQASAVGITWPEQVLHTPLTQAW